MKKTRLVLYILISGILLGCAYPPVGLGFLAYAAIVPMLFIVDSLKTRQVFLWSFVFSLVFHLLTLSWIRHITWIGMILGIVFLSIIYTLPFVITRLIMNGSSRSGIFIFPFAIAGIEWVRTFDVLAFPWMILGNSQACYPWLIQFADITSVYGVSWWVAMVNVSIFLLIIRRSAVRWTFLVLLFVFPLIYSFYILNTSVENEKKLTVALIQGNVMPEEKWGYGNELWNMNLYKSMSIQAMEYKPDIIVWPETATPVYLCEDPIYRRMVQTLVDSLGVPILTGTPAIDFDSGKKWNSSAFFQPGEKKAKSYDKIHLVPFGEAIPFNTIFPFLRNINLGQANWDEGEEIVVFNPNVLPPFNAVICFESIFPDLVRKFVVKGSKFIVVITNDVWFGPYVSPVQHTMISVLRAIEFHLPVLRCANTGISMIIDPYGRITAKTETFERDILIGSFAIGTGKTIYARFGNIFSMFCLFITLISLMLYTYIEHFKRKRIS